jgi:hypothetical protein
MVSAFVLGVFAWMFSVLTISRRWFAIFAIWAPPAILAIPNQQFPYNTGNSALSR